MSEALFNKLNFKWASMRPSNDYRSVPLDEKSDLGSEDAMIPLRSQETRRQRLRRLARQSFFPFVALVLFIALCGVSALYMQLRVELAPRPKLDCGDTMEEALANNCVFDQLNKAWMPPECPRFGLEEYLEVGYAAGSNTTDNQYPYYTDQDMTQEITIKGIAEMAAPYEIGAKWWTSGREHMTHCTWMLIRLAYVYQNDLPKDMLVSNFHHAKHCALFMLDRGLEGEGVDEIRVVGNSIFGGC